MSSDRLREAARRIRATAEAATPGPWEPYPDERGLSDVASGYPERSVDMLNDGTLGAVAQRAYDDDAAHIAMWSPPVALAVALWLDSQAADFEFLGTQSEHDIAALRVANAILWGAA